MPQQKNSLKTVSTVQSWHRPLIFIGIGILILVLLVSVFYTLSPERVVGEAKKFISVNPPKAWTKIPTSTFFPKKCPPPSPSGETLGDATGDLAADVSDDDQSTGGTTDDTPGNVVPAGPGSGPPGVSTGDDQNLGTGSSDESSSEENACPSEEVMTSTNNIVGTKQPLKEKLIRLKKRLFP